MPMKQSLSLIEATDLSIQMASVVIEAKTLPADDMEITELEPPRASAKSKEIKEVSLSLDDCRRNMVGSLPRGMPKVVDYRQTDAQATNTSQDGNIFLSS